jgi:hypothetical protein
MKTTSAHEVWFTSKKTSFGVVPANWKGWIVIVYFLGMTLPGINGVVLVNQLSGYLPDTVTASFWYMAYIAFDLLMFFWIVYQTSDHVVARKSTRVSAPKKAKKKKSRR